MDWLCKCVSGVCFSGSLALLLSICIVGCNSTGGRKVFGSDADKLSGVLGRLERVAQDINWNSCFPLVLNRSAYAYACEEGVILQALTGDYASPRVVGSSDVEVNTFVLSMLSDANNLNESCLSRVEVDYAEYLELHNNYAGYIRSLATADIQGPNLNLDDDIPDGALYEAVLTIFSGCTNKK